MRSRPTPDEYAESVAGYVSLVPETDIVQVLTTQLAVLESISRKVTPDREMFRYSPEKWSVRQVFGHLIDGERIFGYRMFCISRKETANLPSFDETPYVVNSRYHERPLSGLLEEFATVRKANLVVCNWLSDEDWLRMGTASNNAYSVRGIAFVLAGHVRHHLGVLKERYDLG